MEEPKLLDEIESQIAWYEKKCLSCKRADIATQIMVLGIAVSIPAISAVEFVERVYVVMAFSTLLAFLEGFRTIMKYKETWINYRTMLESMRKERFMYAQALGPYRDIEKITGEEPESKTEILARRFLDLTSAENETWQQSASKSYQTG